MDILGKESLEEILKAYKGTLIFVSHDRYFVNKIADSLLIFEKGKVTCFDGNYEEYLRKKEENEDEDAIQDKKVDNTVKEKTNNSYFTNKEINKAQNKITKIEKEIEEKEEKIKNIQVEMLKEENSTNYIKLKELEENIQKINSEIELKMQEWEELNSKLAELKNKL